MTQSETVNGQFFFTHWAIGISIATEDANNNHLLQMPMFVLDCLCLQANIANCKAKNNRIIGGTIHNPKLKQACNTQKCVNIMYFTVR